MFSRFLSSYIMETWKCLSLPHIITRILCGVGRRICKFPWCLSCETAKTKFHFFGPTLYYIFIGVNAYLNVKFLENSQQNTVFLSCFLLTQYACNIPSWILSFFKREKGWITIYFKLFYGLFTACTVIYIYYIYRGQCKYKYVFKNQETDLLVYSHFVRKGIDYIIFDSM